MKTINIIARDIPDAWFQCIFNILDKTDLSTSLTRAVMRAISDWNLTMFG